MNKFGQEMKLCTACSMVQPIEEDFYRAGPYYQKYCKMCYNDKRKKTYKEKHVKRITGFAKLPTELQKNIAYDHSVKINFADIAKKYENQWPLKASQLNYWNRKGQIPKYIHNEE